MRTLIYMILILMAGTLTAQDLRLNYRTCKECLQESNSNTAISDTLYEYEMSTPYETEHIESDFDMRRADGSTRWHKGIDLRNHGAGADKQRGDAIF